MRYRFGRWEVDEDTRQVRYARDLVPLRSKCVDVLLCLLRAAPNPVSKHDLDAAVWGDAVGGDQSIAQAVHTIRTALRDERSVVTIPRVGYRFGPCAQLETVASAGAPVDVLDDPQAFQHYASGVAALLEPYPHKYATAIRCFEKALELNSGFAEAMAALAGAYYSMAISSISTSRKTVENARRHAHRALELDERRGTAAYGTLAAVAGSFDRDFEAAEKLFETALGADPAAQMTRLHFAGFLLERRRLPEALAHVKRLLLQCPQSVAHNTELGLYYELAGEYEAGERQLRFAAGLAAAAVPARHTYGHQLVLRGKYRRALPLLRTIGKMGTPAYGTLGFAHARCNDAPGARRIAGHAARRSRIPHYHGAMIACGLRESRAALDLLEEAAVREPHVIGWAGSEACFEGLRREPRFQRLCERVSVRWW